MLYVALDYTSHQGVTITLAPAMRRDGSYAQFEAKARAAANGSCDATGFCELSKLAGAQHQRLPDRGEDIARLMSSIWAQNVDSWGDKLADSIGQLFADLDLPPHHVAGGKRGAHRKWRELEQLTSRLPEPNSQAA